MVLEYIEKVKLTVQTIEEVKQASVPSLETVDRTCYLARELDAWTFRITSNNFGLTDIDMETGEETKVARGLFPIASLFNHSCHPNAVWSNKGNELSVRALQDFQRGEEICLPYVGTFRATVDRRRDLLSRYRFTCSCALCADSDASPDGQSERDIKVSAYLKACDLLSSPRDRVLTAIQEAPKLPGNNIVFLISVWMQYLKIASPTDDQKRWLERECRCVYGEDHPYYQIIQLRK
jgi:hypothetical protein